jgi:hypothetical protein
LKSNVRIYTREIFKVFEVEDSNSVQIQSCSVQSSSKFSSPQSYSVLFRNSVQVQSKFGSISVQVQFKLKGELQGRRHRPLSALPKGTLTAMTGPLTALPEAPIAATAASTVTDRFEVSLKVTSRPAHLQARWRR